jgi:hypothetical protein
MNFQYYFLNNGIYQSIVFTKKVQNILKTKENNQQLKLLKIVMNKKNLDIRGLDHTTRRTFRIYTGSLPF